MPENHCIFCKIVAGTAPCHRVHEDDQTLTFLDLFPASPGHCLIITRDHHEDIFTASEAELARVAANSLPLARAIKRVTGADGLGVYQLNGVAAGQSVYHYHMHLIPHFTSRRSRIHGRDRGDGGELASMAERLRAELTSIREASA